MNLAAVKKTANSPGTGVFAAAQGLLNTSESIIIFFREAAQYA